MIIYELCVFWPDLLPNLWVSKEDLCLYECYFCQLYFTRQFHCNRMMLKLRFFHFKMFHTKINDCKVERLLTISTNTFRNAFTWTVQMHSLVTEWWHIAPTVIFLPNFAFLDNFQWILLELHGLPLQSSAFEKYESTSFCYRGLALHQIMLFLTVMASSI